VLSVKGSGLHQGGGNRGQCLSREKTRPQELRKAFFSTVLRGALQGSFSLMFCSRFARREGGAVAGEKRDDGGGGRNGLL